MMRLSNLNARNALIAAHDALATALAVLASFYLRFEGGLFSERLPLLLRILPYFVAFSVVVCYFCRLTTTKWRFISLTRQCPGYAAARLLIAHLPWACQPSWLTGLSRPRSGFARCSAAAFPP